MSKSAVLVKIHWFLSTNVKYLLTSFNVSLTRVDRPTANISGTVLFWTHFLQQRGRIYKESRGKTHKLNLLQIIQAYDELIIFSVNRSMNMFVKKVGQSWLNTRSSTRSSQVTQNTWNFTHWNLICIGLQLRTAERVKRQHFWPIIAHFCLTTKL